MMRIRFLRVLRTIYKFNIQLSVRKIDLIWE